MFTGWSDAVTFAYAGWTPGFDWAETELSNAGRTDGEDPLNIGITGEPEKPSLSSLFYAKSNKLIKFN